MKPTLRTLASMMPMDEPKLTRESVERALQFQHAERLKAARDMGIPSWLIDLYEVYGYEQMCLWHALILTMRQD